MSLRHPVVHIVCRSLLQCVATVCCSALWCVAARGFATHKSMGLLVDVDCCSVLQRCVTVSCSALQCVAVYFSALKQVASPLANQWAC